MTQITYIDKDGATTEHPEVVSYIERYADTIDPRATITVYAHKKFNPMEVLEWSLSVTGPQGRKNYEVEQRVAGGAIRIFPSTYSTV